LVQRDPAFRDWTHEGESTDETPDAPDEATPREDDDEEFG
jgi:hypothetical protein